jgi:hypothetical protein
MVEFGDLFQLSSYWDAATKLDIVSYCMQIDALQNIDSCDDFDARRKSANPEVYVAYSAWQSRCECERRVASGERRALSDYCLHFSKPACIAAN